MAFEDYDEDPVDGVEPDDDRELSRRTTAEKARRPLKQDRSIQGSERLELKPPDRSRTTLLLVGSTIAAAALVAIFWFINARNSEDRLLKSANESLEQKNYADAEIQFLKYISLYPRTERTVSAKFGLYRSRVEIQIMTTTPDVIRGLEEFKSFVKDCRELEGFDTQKEILARYADRLTFAGARVSEMTGSQEALDVSVESLELLRKYSENQEIPPDRRQELINRQRIASTSVARNIDFDATRLVFQQKLDAGNTLGALEACGRLIDKYPQLARNTDVQKMLQDILTREKESVIRTEVGKDGLGAQQDQIPSLTPTLRTQAATASSSQGRFVFGKGLDSIFALDADTGIPLWHHAIGVDSPFGPIAIKTTTPAGVLVYNMTSDELELLSQSDGQLLWRQTMGSRPSGVPALIGENLYVSTEAGEFWQIAANSGRAVSKLKLSQTMIGPPAVSGDSQKFVIPGDHQLVYTVSVSSFNCQAVSYAAHRTGSVRAPIIAAGQNYLMCDNTSAERARIRTLQMDETGQLTVVAEDFVDGQVNDPCLLRDSELLVSSTPQRVTAFRVTDEAGQPPLTKIGSTQPESGIQTRMFLADEPGKQRWVGGLDLRTIQTHTNTVVLDSAVAAKGIHVQPVQFAHEAAFLTTQNSGSCSAFLTRADGEQMQGTWQTALGSHLVAIAPSDDGESLVAVTDYGESCVAPLKDIQKGGFLLESVSRFPLPENLSSAIEGLVLKDGRLAVWCGAPNPAMWTFTTTGQLEQKWTLPEAPQVPPVAIDGGVVFAMAGRLHITAIAGDQAAEDYQSSQTQDRQQSWKSLTAISANQVLGVTSDNQFVRAEYRATPRPQLVEVSVISIPQAVEVAPAAASGFLFVATVEGKLLLMQASSLEVLAEADLGGVPDASPLVAGESVFVEVAGKEARVFHIDNTLQQTGTVRLDGFSLASPPLPLADGFLAARTDGLLMRLDSNGTESGKSLALGQSLQQGPIKIHNRTIVAGLDGSLYLIGDELLK